MGSVWQWAPTGSLPRKKPPQRKPRATVEHMLHKRTAGSTEQASNKPRLGVLPNENGRSDTNANAAALVE